MFGRLMGIILENSCSLFTSLKPDSIYLGLANCGQTVDLKTASKPLLNLAPALVAQLDSTVVTIFLRYGYHNRQLDRKSPYWFPCY